MKILIGVIDYLRLTINRQFLTKKMIKRYQLKQLKKIYKYAIKNSVFYNELYKNYPLKSMNDFYKLPVINKTIMMDNFTDLNTCNLNKEEVMDYAVEKENNKDFLGYYNDEFVVGLSSGTSGNKGIFVTPKKMTERLPAVFLARGGFPLSLLPYKILFMLRVFSQGFDDINSKLVSLNYLSTMAKIPDVINKINHLKINILMAPPSFIRELLPYRDQVNVDIKRIMTYAEVLEIEDKLRFEETFNTKVIEIYQASEGQIASSCKQGYLHINEDLVHVELYDEEDNIINEPGTIGHKMIITNLVNYTQPLIRYQMNDMVVLDTKCECGSNFRRIKKVLGRHDDLIYFNDINNSKRYIFPDLLVRWIIVSSENIREFQVVQFTINEIIITIDLINNIGVNPTHKVKKKIEKELIEFEINNPIITIEIKKIILPNNMNKYKRFISHL